MAQILLMVSLGFFLQKKHYLGGEETMNCLTRLLIDVLTPINILASSSRAFSKGSGNSILICLGLSILYYMGSLVLCYAVFRLMPLDRSRRGVAITSSVFANTAFIGYPIVTSLFGQEGMLYASSF